jgi:hypothetical protein
MAETSPLRVLLITGFGRSGSTLLNTILGSVDGVFAGGEIRYLWQRGLVEGRLCGCGQPVTSCPVWSEVVRAAFGSTEGADAPRRVEEDGQVMRTRQLPAIVSEHWLRRWRTPGHALERAGDLADAYARVYRAIDEVTGARLIVDSSKPPSFGYVLENVDGIEVKIVHLVRDPRAAAFSWTRTKALTDGGTRTEMSQQTPLQSAIHWTVWNGAADVLFSDDPARFLRISYEGLVAEPRATLDRILDFAWHHEAPSPFRDERTLEPPVIHAVAGNADRMSSGPLTIRPDAEWTSEMPAGQRRLVTALSLPLLHRYGYAVSPR